MFRPKFGEIAQLNAVSNNAGYNNVEGVAESWVGVEMSCVEVVEAGSSWMEVGGASQGRVEVGARFSNTRFQK